MNIEGIGKNIENYLNKHKLSFRKTQKNDSIIFEHILVGDQTVIAVIPESINIFVKVTTRKDSQVMSSLCNQLLEDYGNITCETRKNRKITLFKIRIPNEANKLFAPIFNEISEKMNREISPFIWGIVSDKPEEFFLKQYKVWKSLPPEEQSHMIEDILILKEKYFSTTKTQKGIIKKLNTLKIRFASENKEVEDKQLLKIVFGEDFANSFEFYLLDFAALFRAIELKLIKLKLKDFFEGFRTGGKK